MRKLHNPIEGVINRIQSIEQKFSQRIVSKENFQEILCVENRKSKKQTNLTENSIINIKNDKFSSVDQIITDAAKKYGVDPNLVQAVAKTESNYIADAKSEAGAIGIMQLMPDTAASLGVNNIYDPRENVEGGTKYIKQLLTTFDGDVTKAIAAYNAGPQAVKKYNGIPPYAETKNYVRKVLDLYS